MKARRAASEMEGGDIAAPRGAERTRGRGAERTRGRGDERTRGGGHEGTTAVLCLCFHDGLAMGTATEPGTGQGGVGVSWRRRLEA